MVINRISAEPLAIAPSTHLDMVRRKLVSENKPILFVLEEDKSLVGVVTKGDILKLPPEAKMSARDVCNTRPKKLSANLPDSVIAKALTERISCIPLVDDANKLVALAVPQTTGERVNLNIGAGATSFEGFINLDVESEWYKQHHETVKFVEYNIITDAIPFDNDSVDNIYISHVIEHLLDEHVSKLFCECKRVLKAGGVLRIACPDAEFLAEISSFENDFWLWRREWFLRYAPHMPLHELTQFDFLVREIATARTGKLRADDFPSNCLAPENREQTLAKMTEGLEFDIDNIGNHINYWSYARVREAGVKAGFNQVIRSKYQGSVSMDMKGPEFDKGRPEMSLYVDLVS